MIAAFSTNAAAQTNVDLGYDWIPETTTIVEATSGSKFIEAQLTYVLNQDAETEVNFVVGGTGGAVAAASKTNVYTSTSSLIPEAYSYATITNAVNEAYFEGYVKDNYSISGIKFNGTSTSESATSEGVVVYSDQTPFDINSITGYATITIAELRAGNAGTTVGSIPTGTKSFRIYNRVRLLLNETTSYYEVVGTGVGGILLGSNGTSTIRLAYVNATINPFTSTSIDNESAGNKIVVSKAFYDLSGRLVPETAVNGILIQKTTFEDGTVSFEKVYRK